MQTTRRLPPLLVLLAVLAGCHPEPALLSETGLYADVATGSLAPDVRPYTPRFELWSDGAAKQRWIQLPAGAVVDTADVDSWSFPEGTKVWKEFVVDGTRVETRMLHKRGPAAEDWTMSAYLWREDQGDADRVLDGVQDAMGTSHDVPAAEACATCHDGIPDRLLGVSAIQLDHDLGGLDLATMAAEGLLSHPPADPLDLPGDDVAQAALGYLHANCGNCHNAGTANPEDWTGLELWLTVASLGAVEDTPTWRTTVGVSASAALEPLEGVAATVLVEPGDPSASLLHVRMGRRGEPGAMPPLASEEVDDAGAAAVAAWIQALAPTQ